jgi:hypothetical protein
MRRSLRWLILGMAPLALLVTLPTTTWAAATPGTLTARIQSAPEATAVKIERLPDSNVFTITASTPDATVLKTINAGTAIEIEVDDVSHPTQITRIDRISVSVGTKQRVLALGISFLVLLGLATAATRAHPLRFLIGLDNRYSNSQSQMVLWFGALAVIYAATVVLRIIYLDWNFVGGVGVTANVIALTGLSALSFGGAKVITTQKTTPDSSNPPQSSPAQLLQPQKTTAPEPNMITDLFQNDRGNADFGDFQMILITLTAVLIYLVSCFVFLGDLWPQQSVTLPDVDTTLLSAFGLGQGAYLIKKAAAKPGEG